MPRQVRIIIPHEAHHITQRGNYRQEIFEDDDDFKQYLTWLKEYSRKCKIEADSLISVKTTFNMDIEEWKQYLKEVDGEADKEVRLKTKRGLVEGDVLDRKSSKLYTIFCSIMHWQPI